MKKMISLAFAALMFIGASAMPKLGAKRVSMQDLTATVDGAIAWRAEGTKQVYENGKNYYEFQVVFYKGETMQAALTIYTLANNKLAGHYAIAPSNATYYCVGESKVPVYGWMSLECKVAQGGTLGTYEVYAQLFDGQGNSVIMTGTMPNFIAMDQKEFLADKTKGGIVLTDAVGLPGGLIGVYTGVYESLDEETYSQYGSWVYMGNDDRYSVVCQMPFDVQDNEYVINNGPYYVQGGYVAAVNTTTNPWTEVNPSSIMRGVMEVEYTNQEMTEANFTALLQCEDGNVYYVYDFEDEASGVEEVEAAETEGTAKVMKDGQLIIIRNGVRYNAQGALVD